MASRPTCSGPIRLFSEEETELTLIFPLYSTSLFKFDNPFPSRSIQKLANDKKQYEVKWTLFVFAIGGFSYVQKTKL